MQLQAKGYLTVFLSLSITIILSLILALYQGARIGALRMKAECVSDISMNSVLAEYHRELFKQYDLLMVDTSYGTQYPSIINVQEHMQFYANKNFERTTTGKIFGAVRLTGMECETIAIPEFSFATDGNGAVFRRQILAYMTAEPAEEILQEVTKNISILQTNGFDTRDVEAEEAENQNKINEIGMPRTTDANGQEQEVQLDGPAEDVASQKGIGILALAIPENEDISDAAVQLSEYVSHRTQAKGTGLDEGEKLSVADAILIDQYMFEKCGRYTKKLDKSLLKYQLEYILSGEKSDKQNLETVAKKLLFWREASNFTYLLSDSEKCAQAEAVAALLAAVILEPELEEPVKYAILFAWAFAESISDLKILFHEGRVPLVKSATTWKTNLLGLSDLRLSGEKGEEGLTYEEYLRMLLFMEGVQTKSQRLMDIIEMDIRKTAGNSAFRMDACLDCFTGEICFIDRKGFSDKIVKTYGYEK